MAHGVPRVLQQSTWMAMGGTRGHEGMARATWGARDGTRHNHACAGRTVPSGGTQSSDSAQDGGRGWSHKQGGKAGTARRSRQKQGNDTKRTACGGSRYTSNTDGRSRGESAATRPTRHRDGCGSVTPSAGRGHTVDRERRGGKRSSPKARTPHHGRRKKDAASSSRPATGVARGSR